ncbi:MAG: NAD-dependent epimerase/dehydratase family protein [Desulfobacterales bacterium]
MGRPETCLVTGGGGFLGKAIVKQLRRRGHAVVSFSRGDYPELAAMGAAHMTGDLCDRAAVENACQGVDVVFHTAAKAGVWGAYDGYFRTNVIGTDHIIDACRKHRVSRLIYTSSASVIYNGKNMAGNDESLPYPRRHLSRYAKTKALAEQRIIAASDEHLRTLVLRPHLIWGPEDSQLVPRIIERANRLAVVGQGNNIADTIYIDNAAEAHVLAADKLLDNPGLSGRVYFISQDDRVPVWEMINRILAAAGRPPVRRRVPAFAAWIIGGLMEMIYAAARIDREPPMTRFVARELSTSHWYDISAAKRDLGFFPRISTKEGLNRLRDWLQDTSVTGPPAVPSG